MARTHTLDELARHVGGRLRGRGERVIGGIAPLEDAGEGELSFFTNPRYRRAAEATRAGAILVAPGAELPDHDLLEVSEPYAALAALLELFHPVAPRRAEISPLAHVAAGVSLGRDVAIEPYAVVGEGAALGDRVRVGSGSVIGESCRVGDDTELRPLVVLYPGTWVGRRCLVHSGAVLGADGFGFATTGGVHRKIPQVGRVVVEDDVEIGANSAVDRATLGETRVGAGSKIDDLVMVAHGVKLGPHCLLAAQTGIAGSTRVGHHAAFGGQAGAIGHLALGDRVAVAAKAAVYADVEDGVMVAGVPALEHRQWKRIQAVQKRLPEMREALRRLEARVAALEGRPLEEDTP